MPRLKNPFTPLLDHEVFAVEANRAQLCVRTPDADVAVKVAGKTISSKTTNGVAVVTVADLHPNTTYMATVSDGSDTTIGQVSFTTRPALTGPTTRFATISDVHLGTVEFGGQRSICEPEETDPPFTLRCARAAITEAIAWGAEALFIKGDLTDTGSQSDWELVDQLLDGVQVPVFASWGNHDVWKTRELEPSDAAKRRSFTSGQVVQTDFDQVRAVLLDTSIADRGMGSLSQHRDELLDSLKTDAPVFLGIHHNIMRTPIPWFWPAGISSTDARPVVNDIAAVNRNVLISSGHTHRNRRHRIGPGGAVTFTEVAATADYPGCWAGYEASHAMLRQTVHRIAAPEALLWSERVRAALKGVWPRWSQGALDDRCVDMATS